MKGLIIWAKSTCRSAMGLYSHLGEAFGVPVKICTLYSKCEAGYSDMRIQGGMLADEFPEIEKEVVGYGMERGRKVLASYKGWNHLFCVYHKEENYRGLLLEAHGQGDKVAIMSESPCVMLTGLKGIAKRMYLKTVLPWRVHKVIKAADFFVNYSGDDPLPAMGIGWPREKIIPFGYFMPPVPGSSFVQRDDVRVPFEILSSGSMTWHRGCDVLVRALALLHARGVSFHATITQRGPLYERVKRFVETHNLPVSLPGFVSLEELIRLYECCSVYVGAGRSEPWGMRLNEALCCGAPLVVSRGMGGVQMVDRYGCGLSFKNGDPVSLADCLQRLADDRGLYKDIVNKCIGARDACLPDNKAFELVRDIRDRFPDWR